MTHSFDYSDSEATLAIENVYETLVADKMITRSVDDISYTEDFERLYMRISRVFPLTRCEVFERLMNLRKKGRCSAPHGRKRRESKNK